MTTSTLSIKDELDFILSLDDIDPIRLAVGISTMERREDRDIIRLENTFILKMVNSFSNFDLIINNRIVYHHWPSVFTYFFKNVIYSHRGQQLEIRYHGKKENVILSGSMRFDL